ncbi:MAG TPA: ABC transporter permease [Spirochaetia bacterium]|nr:ABC transporter permease [Spirochaetia bacterium]
MSIGKRLRILGGFREATTLVIMILICVVMSIISPYFMTANNIRTTVLSFSINGLVVIAMTVVLISGGIDLSVGAVMALVGVITGSLFLAKVNIWIAAFAGVGIGVVIGTLNGFFVTRVGLSPFIATLAMGNIARGASYVISRGMPLPLQSLPPDFKYIGRGMIGGTGIPFLILLFAIVVIAFDFLSRRSTIIRRIYYVGSSEKAARFSGINVTRLRMGVYILAGVLGAIAGVFSISRFNSATPYYADGVEMILISACVIGGASLNGGEGTIFGSILGIALLAVIQGSLILMDVSVYWQQLVTGLILLIAVSLDFLTHRKKKQ